MPKNEVKKERVSIRYLKSLIKNYDIDTFKDLAERIGVNQKTFSRMNKREIIVGSRKRYETIGYLSTKTIDKICKYLDVDMKYATGYYYLFGLETVEERDKKPFFIHYGCIVDEYMRLEKIDTAVISEHPYYNIQNIGDIDKCINSINKNLFKLYGVGFDTYNSLSKEDLYKFEKDLHSVTYKLMKKHFKRQLKTSTIDNFESYLIYAEDCLDDDKQAENLRCYFLENIPENYTVNKLLKMSNQQIVDLGYALYEKEQAEELRKEFLKKIPQGYTKTKIKKMSSFEILDLQNDTKNDPFITKYQ